MTGLLAALGKLKPPPPVPGETQRRLPGWQMPPSWLITACLFGISHTRTLYHRLAVRYIRRQYQHCVRHVLLSYLGNPKLLDAIHTLIRNNKYIATQTNAIRK